MLKILNSKICEKKTKACIKALKKHKHKSVKHTHTTHHHHTKHKHKHKHKTTHGNHHNITIKINSDKTATQKKAVTNPFYAPLPYTPNPPPSGFINYSRPPGLTSFDPKLAKSLKELAENNKNMAGLYTTLLAESKAKGGEIHGKGFGSGNVSEEFDGDADYDDEESSAESTGPADEFLKTTSSGGLFKDRTVNKSPKHRPRPGGHDVKEGPGVKAEKVPTPTLKKPSTPRGAFLPDISNPGSASTPSTANRKPPTNAFGGKTGGGTLEPKLEDLTMGGGGAGAASPAATTPGKSQGKIKWDFLTKYTNWKPRREEYPNALYSKYPEPILPGDKTEAAYMARAATQRKRDVLQKDKTKPEERRRERKRSNKETYEQKADRKKLNQPDAD